MMGLETNNRNTRIIRAVMFPFLAYGHISPFLDLAKKLSHRHFHIYLCSTTANLSLIKHNLTSTTFPSIQLVELNLPSITNLPPHRHTTKGLPLHLYPSLYIALQMSAPAFSNILETLRPDLLISDYILPWAAAAALKLKIPTVQFILSGPVSDSNVINTLLQEKGSSVFPLRSNYLCEEADISTPSDQIKVSLERSSNIILFRSFREIESKSIDDVSALMMKKVVLVGPLVEEKTEEVEEPEITKEWLKGKNPSSVVFVSFGTGYFLSKEERKEIADGLLLSGVDFIWVLTFPEGEEMSVEEALPEGFMEKLGGRGLVLDWAPQKRVLADPSVGGFVSHCGWSSVMESMRFGVPIIAMPILYDQPRNAKAVTEAGVGMEVKRDEEGKFGREEIGKVIREVMGGENEIRRKAEEMKGCIREKGDKEIDEVVGELYQLVHRNRDTEPRCPAPVPA